MKQDFLSSGLKQFSSKQQIIYFINLEEFIEKTKGKLKNRTLIKMVKKYAELQNFNNILFSTYPDIDENQLNLPPESNMETFETNSEEIKKKWDDYFYYMLKIPKIEQNESFRDFFNLNRLGVSFEFTRGDSEIFDFT